MTHVRYAEVFFIEYSEREGDEANYRFKLVQSYALAHLMKTCVKSHNEEV